MGNIIPVMDVYELTDDQVLAGIGKKIEQLRLERDISQIELAADIGVTPKTYRAFIAGKGKMETLVAVLRYLESLELLSPLSTASAFSPMELVAAAGQARQRASKRLNKSTIATDGKTGNEIDDGLDW